VHFVQVGENLLCIRSFERGVEGETLSCGSGAVAAAQVALAEGWLSSPVVVKTASGRNLQVRATGSAAFGPVELTGPAEPVASGEVAPELLAWENGL
jgi:diaminopimelate epimerase